MNIVLGKRCKTKGISPLVASVLLIAITMTIAGLLAYWAASFVKTSLPSANETEAQCRFADFSIYSCAYANRTVTLILENLRDVELTRLKAYFIFANNTVSNPYDLNATLPGGMLRSYSVSNVDDFVKISIKTHCPDVNEEKACAKS